jgi:hypothetical protein
MFETRIQIEKGQRLTLVEIAGDLTISSWDEADVLILLRDGEERDLTVEQMETGPAVSARAAGEVKVPAASAVAVRQVLGNLKASGLVELNAEQVRGNLKLSEIDQAVIAEVYGNLKAETAAVLRLVGTVHGNATLSAVQSADLQNVRGNLRVKTADHLRASRIGGNLEAKELSGTLDADQVGGNAVLKGIAGVVTLDQVAGNLTAKNLSGGAQVPTIGGNLVLNGGLGTGCTYQFHARGNAVLRLPEGSSAHLTLRARGQILPTLTLADQRREGDTLTGTLGDGGAEIAVEAAGNITLTGGEATIGVELGEEISRQMEESLQAIDLEEIGRQVSEEMEAALSRLQVKLEGVDWERIGVHTQQTVERAMEQMRRNMDRMADKAARHQERLEQKMERERRRYEERARRHAAEAHRHAVEVDVPDWPAAEMPRAEGIYEPAEPAPNLDEERLSILRMVEQGQITPEEAEMLLDALQ